MTHLTKSLGERTSRRNLVAAGAAVAALAAILAGVALAADTKVSLTATGPQPQTLTVSVGDSVTFTNTDNVNHSIVTKSPAGSAPGGFVSPVIHPGETYSVGLNNPGTISYAETGFGHQKGSGKIVVGVSGALTIATAQKAIVYGASITISGKSPVAGTNVSIDARGKGQKGGGGNGGGKGGWTTVATVPAGSDGSFTATLTPTATATYRAQLGSGQVTSATVSVSVAPQLLLHATTKRVVHAGKLVTLVGKIVPANGAQSLELMAYNKSKRNWTRVSTRSVSAAGTATFRFAVPYGLTPLRLSVSRSDQVLPGLLKTMSAQSLVVRGTGTPPPPTGKHHKKHH